MIKQTTLGSAVETHGIGLHTAVPVQVRLVPAPPDTGYVFRRTDLGGFEIPATVESVAHCGYATTLMRTGVMLSTVEHLLAALRGLNVDNVFIEVDNLEIPIMDGSAENFAEIIERAGVVQQPLARRALLIREKVAFEQGDRRISVGGSLARSAWGGFIRAARQIMDAGSFDGFADAAPGAELNKALAPTSPP